MSSNVINVYKKCGQTPLDCINEIKKANPEMTHLPLTYAGRLDPLAEGVLLILVGEECLKKDDYLALPKEYELTILFGFETDTYDLMGKVVDVVHLSADSCPTSTDNLGKLQMSDTCSNSCRTSVSFPFTRTREDEGSDYKDRQMSDTCSSSCRTPEENFLEVQPQDIEEVQPQLASEVVPLYMNSEDIKNILPTFIGRINQAYPPYSSRTVNGKPLFQWAREGKLDEIIIPSHDVFVENIEILKEDFISGFELFEKIKKDIGKVKGDFRQDEILFIWKENLKNNLENKNQTLTLRVSCGSGVYVRAIAHELGKKLGVPALALNIKRTRVGEYIINS